MTTPENQGPSIMRARNVPAVAHRAAEQGAELDVMMRRAQTIARAGDAVPRSYRGNAGAVLLANEWAAARGLDLLTALQTVSFIDGRPVVDATLQRALARRAGYDVRPISVDDQSATVRVVRDDEVLGEATFTMADAKAAKLSEKNNWKQNPKAMLVARATTQAMRWYAPDVMVGVFTDDDEVTTLDPVAVLDPDPEPEVVQQIEGQQTIEDIADAEVITEAEVADASTDDSPADDELIARVRDAVNAAKSSGAWPEIATTLQAAGVPLQPHRLNVEQAAFVLELTS